jgi:hypothetical protein
LPLFFNNLRASTKVLQKISLDFHQKFRIFAEQNMYLYVKAKTEKSPILAFRVIRGLGVVHNYIFVF